MQNEVPGLEKEILEERMKAPIQPPVYLVENSEPVIDAGEWLEDGLNSLKINSIKDRVGGFHGMEEGTSGFDIKE